MNLVGIDFSINSPAFCCLKDGKYIWGSITRSDRSEESLCKNNLKPFYLLSRDPYFVLLFTHKRELPAEYTEREREKIVYFSQAVDSLWGAIKRIMGNDPFHLAMEGLSFSSNGNSLIDISMATALLRDKIIRDIGTEKFHVFSPTSIKKFALKGNAKKDELYVALSKYEEPETNLSHFTKILNQKESEWITPAKAVNKPIDDLVDATWINLYLKRELRNFYGIEENFERTLTAVL